MQTEKKNLTVSQMYAMTSTKEERRTDGEKSNWE